MTETDRAKLEAKMGEAGAFVVGMLALAFRDVTL
jgi:hypothetical protein